MLAVKAARTNRMRWFAVAMGLLVAPWLLFVFVQPLAAQSGITSPAAGSTLSGDVPVIGTADIESFSKYELHYKLEPSGDDAFVYFDGNTVVVQGGQLGVWRAAGLPGGVYTLRLRVVKADGNYAEFYAPNLSVNQGPEPTPTSDEPSPTPTSDVPTPTWTPAPSATPNVGAVQQPQLETPSAPPPPDPNAAAPAGGEILPPATAPVTAGDLGAADQSVATVVVTTGETETSSLSRSLGEALSIERLRGEFARGMRWSAALALITVAVYAAKRIFDWARRKYG